MHFIENAGLSMLDPKIPRFYQKAHWSVSTQLIKVMTLRQIWNEHISQGQEAHFLKIDIEGLAEAAIRGNDWELNRPWVILIKSTFQMTQIESHLNWEPIFLQSGYIFAYSDGLNRF